MDHGFMPIVVEVLSRTEYDTWLASQKAAAQTLAERRPQCANSCNGRNGARAQAQGTAMSTTAFDTHGHACTAHDHKPTRLGPVDPALGHATNHKDIGTMYLVFAC